MNIFAIDPVAGGFGTTGSAWGSKRSTERHPPDEKDYRKLSTTVKNCIVTLAMDEQREGFAPLDFGNLTCNRTKTNVVWLPFPGIHSTQLRMEPRDGESATRPALTAVPYIVWDLAYDFLTKHGTQFRTGILSDKLRFPQGQLESESTNSNLQRAFTSSHRDSLSTSIILPHLKSNIRRR
jgi:hypothetical protein